jgi:hypothetical protein
VVVVPAEGSVDGSVDVLVLEVESVLLVDPLVADGSLDVVEEVVSEPLDVLSDVEVDDGVELEVSLGVDELEVSVGVDEDELEVSVGVDEPVDEDELEVSLGVDELEVSLGVDELEVSLGVDELEVSVGVDEPVDEPPDVGVVVPLDEPPDLGVVVPVDEPPDVGVVVPVDEPPDDGLDGGVSVGELVGSGDPPAAPPPEAEVLTRIGADAEDKWPAASFATSVNV